MRFVLLVTHLTPQPVHVTAVPYALTPDGRRAFRMWHMEGPDKVSAYFRIGAELSHGEQTKLWETDERSLPSVLRRGGKLLTTVSVSAFGVRERRQVSLIDLSKGTVKAVTRWRHPIIRWRIWWLTDIPRRGEALWEIAEAK